jgi:hypothetical protein
LHSNVGKGEDVWAESHKQAEIVLFCAQGHGLRYSLYFPLMKLVCFLHSLEVLVKQVTVTAHVAATVLGEGEVIKEIN